MRAILALLILLLAALPAQAPAQAQQRFVAIAFHDVIDDGRDLDLDDITTGQLIAFLDWLRGNGWTAVSLDDLDAARSGARPLPPRAILLSFDDGYRSAYTRVFPLLAAYRMPAVFALVGAWMDVPPGGTVRYGRYAVPRSNFLSWAEAREMQASGLAEFATHSYDLHREVRGNPQGSMLPAAGTWTYDPATATYESDAALRARIRRDLERARRQVRTHLGRAPRALVWPFGRTSGPALAAASDAGFTYAMNLEDGPADLSLPMRIARLYPALDPRLGALAEGVRFSDPQPTSRRVVCLSLDAIARGDAAARDAALGATIEAVRALGANTLVLDPAVAVPAGAAMGAVWFPTRYRPLAVDFLSFAAWQLRSRAGVELFLRVDLRAIAGALGEAGVPALVQDIVRVAPIDGLLIDPPGSLLTTPGTRIAPYYWDIRRMRDAIDPATLDADGRLALAAWRAANALRPRLRLALAAPAEPPGAWPAAAADWLLAAPPADDVPALARRLAARGWLAPDIGQRLVLPLPAGDPRAAVRAMRATQALGATAFGLCPATSLPADPALAATFSAATFPLRP